MNVARTDLKSDAEWTINSAHPASRSWSALTQQSFQDLWKSRALARRLFVRNFQSAYRQSLLGWLWIFLPAMANAGVWVLLNSSGTVRISQLSGVRYAAFVFVGTVLWQAFTDGLVAPMNTLQANRSAFTKLPFPKEVFVLISFLETGFDFLIRMSIAIVLLIVTGLFHPLGALALLLGWGPLLIVLGNAAGLILAPFGMLYKDVSQTLTMLLPVWMLLTPVIYPMPGNGGEIIGWINPPAALVHLGREAVMPLSSPNDVGDENALTNQGAKEEPTTTSAPIADRNDTQSVTEEPGLTQERAENGKTARAVTADSAALWAPAAFWGLTGIVFAYLGLLWLRLTSPIVIERLAN